MTTCVPVGRASSQDKERNDAVDAGEPFFCGGEAAVAEVGDIKGGWELFRRLQSLDSSIWGGCVSGNAETGHSLTSDSRKRGKRISPPPPVNTKNETNNTGSQASVTNACSIRS